MTCIKDLNIVHHVPSLIWNPPEVRLLKVNFDGASCSNPGPSGFGCVLRDANGQVMGVKGGPLGVIDAMHTETMGLLEGLKLARDKGAMGCLIEGDSYSVISWGKGEMYGSGRLNHLISEIRCILRDIVAVLLHVPRAQNSLVDRIAKWSVDQDYMFVGDCLPECLM